MSDNKKATQDGPDMVSIRLADDFFARFADDSGKINATRIREYVEDLEQQLKQPSVGDEQISEVIARMAADAPETAMGDEFRQWLHGTSVFNITAWGAYRAGRNAQQPPVGDVVIGYAVMVGTSVIGLYRNQMEIPAHGPTAAKTVPLFAKKEDYNEDGPALSKQARRWIDDA